MNGKKRDFSRLKRDIHRMPVWVRRALLDRGLMAAYRERPPYQQNDYIGWITHAKLETTRRKRLAVMLAELAHGSGYMKMPYRPNVPVEEIIDELRDLRIATRRLRNKKDPVVSALKKRRKVPSHKN